MKDYIEQGLSAKQVSELFKVSPRRVHYLANKEGLHFLHKSKYNLNYKLFTEQLHTENTYYILGYLFSDGYINELKGSINITSKDKQPIIEMVKYIGDIPILKTETDCYYIQWYSKEHIQQLKNIGCTQNKSLTLKFPNLKKELIHHFIRGYFDGDGSIGFYKHRKMGVLRLSIAGTCDFLEGINRILDKEYSIRKIKNTNIYLMSLNGNKIVSEFCNIIYKNSTICMKRKYKIFRGFIQYRYLIENNYK